MKMAMATATTTTTTTTKVPQWMRACYPKEFSPKSIFFFPSENRKDWADCFPAKAAAVYFAIFKKDGTPIDTAENLFKLIAQNCDIAIRKKQSESKDNINNMAKDPSDDMKKTMDTTKAEDLSDDIKKTIDAVYLVMGFLQEFDRKKIDKDFMSRHGTHVVSDIAMLDNQLSLTLILNVFDNLEHALNVTAEQKQISDDKISWASFKNFKLATKDKLLPLFSWYYSPFYAADNMELKPLKYDVLIKNQTLLDCIHQYIVQTEIKDDKQTETKDDVPRIPNAKELMRAGVKFEANAEGLLAIKFDKPLLKLPALFFDSKLETVAMNLVALESSCLTRPVTRYFQLMNELVEDVGDVRVLKRFGVVRGRWKRDEDVVDLVRRVDELASYPSMYPGIDGEISKVKKYYDERIKKFFVKHPALKWVSSAAAVSFVAATAVFAVKRRGR